MKKYFLILFGNFESETCNQIAITVSPIVDSPQLKFQSSHNFILMHFASEVDRLEIYEYLHANLFDKVGSFILSENNDNMSVFMPEDNPLQTSQPFRPLPGIEPCAVFRARTRAGRVQAEAE